MTTTIQPPKPTAANDKVWCTDLGKFKYVGVCCKCKSSHKCKDYQDYLSPRLA